MIRLESGGSDCTMAAGFRENSVYSANTSKLREDQRTAKAEIAVIVSQCQKMWIHLKLLTASG